MPYTQLRGWVCCTKNLLHLLALWFHHLLLNNVLSFSRLLLFARWELKRFLHVHLFSTSCHILWVMSYYSHNAVIKQQQKDNNKSENQPRFTFPHKERKKYLVPLCYLCTSDVCIHGYENYCYYAWRALSPHEKCQFLRQRCQMFLVMALVDLCSSPLFYLCHNFQVSLHHILWFGHVSIVMEINYSWKTSFPIMFLIMI